MQFRFICLTGFLAMLAIAGCKKDEEANEPEPSPSYLFTFNDRKMGEYGNSTVLLPSGDLVICGYTTNNFQDGDVYRIDQNGNEIWRTLPTPAGNYTNISSIALNTDGSLFICGSISSMGSATGPDMFVARLTASGDTVWTKSFIEPGSQLCRNIIAAGDGTVLVTAVENLPSGGSEIILLKLDSNGGEVWSTSFSSAYIQDVQHLSRCSNGDLLIAGFSAATSQSSGEPLLIRTDNAGNLIWRKNIPLYHGSELRSAMELTNGDLMVCGNGLYYPYTLLNYGRLNASGDTLWTRTLTDSLDFTSAMPCWNCMQVLDANNIYIAGAATGALGFDTDNSLVKINGSGNVIWRKSFGSSESNAASNLLIDDNKLLITGESGSNVYMARAGLDGNF